MKKIIVFLYLISCFFLPPMAMSHGYLLKGCIANLLLAILAYANSSDHANLPFMRKYGLLVFVVGISVSLLPDDSILAGTIVGCLSYLSIYLFFSSESNTRLFFKYYVALILMLSVGAITTEILCLYYPLDKLHLHYLDFSVNRYEYDIYFPFDIISPYWTDHHGSSLNRHYLFFGEPGIAPAFMFPALCMIYYGVRNKARYFKIAIIAIAMVTTISTTFPFALFGGIFLIYFFSHSFSPKQYFVLAILGAGAVYAFLYMPYFGYYAKLNSDIYSVNVESREGMVSYWVKQVQFVATILLTYIISRRKANIPVYKSVNIVIAVCALANIMFFSNLHMIFLLMFEIFTNESSDNKYVNYESNSINNNTCL